MTDESNTSRRAILKSAAAGVTASLGVAGATGSAAAQPGRPADRIEAEELFERHGTDVLSILAEEGLLDRGEISELSADRPALPGKVATKVEGTALFDRGATVDRLVSVTHVAEGVLSVVVEPDAGRSYAILEADDSYTVFDPDFGRVEDVVATSSCTQYACSPDTDGCYESTSLSYEGREVRTDGCCSYYQCTDP